MKSIDITVVINGHREGKIISSTLISSDNAIECALRQGLSLERLIILDNADDATRETILNHQEKFGMTTVHNVNFGDLGESRNFAVSKAAGKWIAFIDADDLVSSNWLSSAFTAAENEIRPTVWHPELNIYFGPRKHIFQHIDMDSPSFHASGLALTNYWTALCFAPRELLLKIPYAHTDFNKQIGYEDWSWNLRVMEKDYIHKIVPNTAHLIRTKEQSLLTQTNSAGCMPAPTTYFQTHYFNPNKT